MGYALASAARDIGMEVTLISGAVNLPIPQGVDFIFIDTALELKEAMDKYFVEANLIIMCAAVSDHRPMIQYENKLRKEEFPTKIILEKNPDILKDLGSKKKNLDWIVANDVSRDEIGFSSDKNEVTLIDASGLQKQIPFTDKSIIAKDILHAISLSCLQKVH